MIRYTPSKVLRIQRFEKDPGFRRLVEVIKNLVDCSPNITYTDILDAAFVAQMRYELMNPSVFIDSYPDQKPMESDRKPKFWDTDEEV